MLCIICMGEGLSVAGNIYCVPGFKKGKTPAFNESFRKQKRAGNLKKITSPFTQQILYLLRCMLLSLYSCLK